MSEHTTIAVAMSGGVDSSTAAAMLAPLRRKQSSGSRCSSGIRRGWRASMAFPMRRRPAAAVRSMMCTTRGAWPSTWAFRITSSTRKSASSAMWCGRLSMSISPGARRFPARSATTTSSSTSCSRPRAASAPSASPPATTRSTNTTQARGRWILKRPADLAKDQTYFLFGLTQEQLARTLFPLGHMTKPEVREVGAPAWAGAGRKARLAGDLLHSRRRLQAVLHGVS